VVEQPAQFRRRKIRVNFKAAALADQRRLAGARDFVAEGRRPPVLPDDRGRDRRPGRAVPEQCRLALVGDADRGDLGGVDRIVAQYLARDRKLRLPDFHRVVFDPAGLGIVLAMLLLRRRVRSSVAVEQDGARTRRPLVERQDESLFHRFSLRLYVICLDNSGSQRHRLRIGPEDTPARE
jgi:hypothetical protein